MNFNKNNKISNFRMILKSCLAKINAHGRSEISSMIQNRSNPNEFVTIAHDGMLKIWNAETMTMVASARIKCGYLTSVINYEEGFVVGTGSGELIKFTEKLEKQWSRKIHQDCVTDVLQTERYLISVGFDGKICFMTKPTLAIEKEIDLSVPLSKITQVENDLYVAGNPSFKINLGSFEITKQKRSSQFIEHKNRIIGCSDQKGLQILGVKQHVDQVHCHFMLQFKGKIIVVSESSIGVVDFERSEEGDDEDVSYRFYRTSVLKKGYAVTSGFAYKDCVVLASEDGQVYKFEFMDEQ